MLGCAFLFGFTAVFLVCVLVVSWFAGFPGFGFWVSNCFARFPAFLVLFCTSGFC